MRVFPARTTLWEGCTRLSVEVLTWKASGHQEASGVSERHRSPTTVVMVIPRLHLLKALWPLLSSPFTAPFVVFSSPLPTTWSRLRVLLFVILSATDSRLKPSTQNQAGRDASLRRGSPVATESVGRGREDGAGGGGARGGRDRWGAHAINDASGWEQRKWGR